MTLSAESLTRLAGETGFRIEFLEKVDRLVELLQELFEDTFLATRLALKGGTALNLFHFDLPRLSVDIDLNYIGALDREMMLDERPRSSREFKPLQAARTSRSFVPPPATPAASGAFAIPAPSAGAATWKLTSTTSTGNHCGRCSDSTPSRLAPSLRVGFQCWIFTNWPAENWRHCFPARLPATCSMPIVC